MPRTSNKGRRERGRSGPAHALLTGTLLAGLCLSGPTGGPGCLAEDQKPAGAPEPDEKAPAAKPTPAPKAGPTPKPGATPTKSTLATAKGVAPAPTPEPVLRFDDLDLERFHRSSPAADDERETGTEGGETTVAPPAAAPPGAVAGAAAARKPPRGPQARPKPQPVPETSSEDPLKPFKDREAKEKFRTEQIQGMRARLAEIQTRLDYLQARRQAILNPLMGMPKPPSGQADPDDASLRPKELVERLDAEIKGLEEQREQAQDELASIETRFAQESPSR